MKCRFCKVRDAYFLMLEIEKLPPSEQQTRVITMAGKLRDDIRQLESNALPGNSIQEVARLLKTYGNHKNGCCVNPSTGSCVCGWEATQNDIERLLTPQPSSLTQAGPPFKDKFGAKYPPMSSAEKLIHAAELYSDLAEREGSEQDRDAAAMLTEVAAQSQKQAGPEKESE